MFPAVLTVRDPSLAGKTELIERVARSSLDVVILGETGTGKEVFARTLHALSRRPGELLAINCAAVFESELLGLLSVAGTGTVFLDEVGELPAALQGTLLHALDASEARTIATIARGEPRADLYAELSGVTVELIPLRERREQIAALAYELLAETTRAAGRAAPHLTAAAVAALTAYDWPGNVRELRLVIAHAVLLAGETAIDARHILIDATRSRAPEGVSRAEFVTVAHEHRGNASAIARVLHTSRSHVRRLALRFEVDLVALRR